MIEIQGNRTLENEEKVKSIIEDPIKFSSKRRSVFNPKSKNQHVIMNIWFIVLVPEIDVNQ